jgi:HEAT repeat protein
LRRSGLRAAVVLVGEIFAACASQPATQQSSPAPARRAPAAAAASAPAPTPTLDPARPLGIDDSTVLQLAEKLGDGDRRVRWYAARQLGVRSSEAVPAVPALSAALSDEEDVALAAAEALRRIGPPAVSATPALVEMLGSERSDARRAAALALAGIGPSHDHEALRRIAGWLDDEDRQIRKAAAEALWGVGPGLASVLDALVAALASPEPATRQSAARLIASAGPAAAAAVPPLYGALRDENARVREEAWRAIRAVRSE